MQEMDKVENPILELFQNTTNNLLSIEDGVHEEENEKSKEFSLLFPSIDDLSDVSLDIEDYILQKHASKEDIEAEDKDEDEGDNETEDENKIKDENETEDENENEVNKPESDEVIENNEDANIPVEDIIKENTEDNLENSSEDEKMQVIE